MKQLNRMFGLVMMASAISLTGPGAGATELNRCWTIDPAAAQVPFDLPGKICIQSATVQWHDDYPSHNLLLKGDPFAGAFVLEELGDGDTTNSVLVEATLQHQVQSDGKCYMKKAAYLRFRFEVSYDAKTIYNNKMYADYFETDQNCRTTGASTTISYYPQE